ncbi:9053_t:CDS:2 [Diversispora eburnea]|uniref:9053_t:CDS:1 n=1 Tax=Diversispora eburnea TaxID=1213867 RepID=A0A9N9A533_9GLOM|nr:9053_t:CDS:2 [Diversispora eburnea]
MSQMPAAAADGEEFFDPMNMDDYDEIHMDNTAGPSHQPSYNIRDGGDKTVDQDFFNDFPDDFDDEDLK